MLLLVDLLSFSSWFYHNRRGADDRCSRECPATTGSRLGDPAGPRSVNGK